MRLAFNTITTGKLRPICLVSFNKRHLLWQDGSLVFFLIVVSGMSEEMSFPSHHPSQEMCFFKPNFEGCLTPGQALQSSSGATWV